MNGAIKKGLKMKRKELTAKGTTNINDLPKIITEFKERFGDDTEIEINELSLYNIFVVTIYKL